MCSINERLGALLPPSCTAGIDAEPLSQEFLAELLEVALLEADELPEAPDFTGEF